jgi:hypothetical protein
LSGHQAFRSTRQVYSLKSKTYCSKQFIDKVINRYGGIRFNPWRGFFSSQYYVMIKGFSSIMCPVDVFPWSCFTDLNGCNFLSFFQDSGDDWVINT